MTTAHALRLAPGLDLPLDAVTRTFGILAVRGAGKSNTAAVMAEEMHAAGLPFVVVDPVGSWYGLRSSADGTRPGLPIPIFGGRHGDVPLERGGGELVADLVVDKRLTCVLDLSGFDSEADKKAFLLAFARRLYLKNENPLHLFLEEADDYIPQSPMGDEKHLLRAWENIVRRGRSRGLGMTLITQRSAAVSKMVLTQVETLFAMRTTGPQDIAAIEAWVKYHQVGRDVLASLSSLASGEAWVWSPHYLGTMARHQIRRRRTFDSGATPTNVKASDTRPPATLADIDVAALRDRMAATIEKAKADDPKALRATIADLRRQLAERPTVAPEPVERPVFRDGELDDMRAALETYAQRVADLGRLVSDLAQSGSVANQAIFEARQAVDGAARPAPAAQHRPRHDYGYTAQVRVADVTLGEALPDGERAVLTAIAQQGTDGATREQVSILTGYKKSTRDAYVQRLKGRGLVDVVGDRIAVTTAGRATLGPAFEPLPTGEKLRAYWLDRLPDGERAVFAVVLAGYPRPVTRDAISARTDYKKSTRDAYIQRLRARRLVEVVERGAVRASEALFA